MMHFTFCHGIIVIAAAIHLICMPQYAYAGFDLSALAFCTSTKVVAPTPVAIVVPVPVPVPAPVIPVPVPVPVPAPPTPIPTPTPTTPILVNPLPTTPTPSPPPPGALLQSTAAPSCLTPAQLLQSRGDVNTFLSLMRKANLTGFLSTQSAVQTIFAPTDAAFTSLLQSECISLNDLLNSSKLQYILQNHILPNLNVLESNMNIGSSWPTVNANDVLTVASPVGQAIKVADQKACNSIVHVMNVVLVPSKVLPLGTCPTSTAAAATSTTPTAPTAAAATSQAAVVTPTAVAVPVTAPSSYSASLDITKINASTGRKKL